MQSSHGPLFFILIAVVVAVFIALGWYFAMKRRKALAAWCARNGLRFDPAKNYSFDERYPALHFLQEGENRYAYNVMTGDWHGRNLIAFDYHYETYSTNSKGERETDHTHLSAALLASAVPLKPLFIRPEGLLDKLTSFFGFEDINFESAEFSRSFFVKADDKRWAYDVIHPRMMEYLLAAPRFRIQFDQQQIAVSLGRTFKVEEFNMAASLAQGMQERLPEYLVKEQQKV